MNNTIAAIGTALGEGGIGIVRLSGPASETIIEKLFVPANPLNWENRQSHKLYLGHFKKNPQENIFIDEVLVVIMKEPNSYTGEEIAEIHCHGGLLAVSSVLESVLAMGAVLAEPGEFTRRAFLNGKLDLTQAEATLDLIRAGSEAGLKIAASQLEGNLTKKINFLQEELLKIIAFFEVKIDFPDEEIDDLSNLELENKLNNLIKELEKLLKGYNQGRIIQEGLKTVIFGKPNVGKSSLLNAILGKERAIVTHIPGTTRDLIIETVYLGGIPIKLIDTAGVRLTEDLVEKIGVEKTKETLQEADLALLVLDGSSELGESDYLVFEMAKEIQIPLIVLLNKIDLENQIINKEQLERVFNKGKILEISALKGQGLNELEDEIKLLFNFGKIRYGEEPILTRIRHRDAINNALKHIKETLDYLKLGYPEDFLTIDLKAAWDCLAEVIGQNAGEEILDKIFAEFCIGK